MKCQWIKDLNKPCSRLLKQNSNLIYCSKHLRIWKHLIEERLKIMPVETFAKELPYHSKILSLSLPPKDYKLRIKFSTLFTYIYERLARFYSTKADLLGNLIAESPRGKHD